jgi:hypothetical protein
MGGRSGPRVEDLDVGVGKEEILEFRAMASRQVAGVLGDFLNKQEKLARTSRRFSRKRSRPLLAPAISSWPFS